MQVLLITHCECLNYKINLRQIDRLQSMIQISSVKFQSFQGQSSHPKEETILKCRKGNSAAYFCSNAECEFPGILCRGQKECLCQRRHRNCSRITLYDIKRKLSQKQKTMEPFIESILRQFDTFIEQVTDKRNQVKIRLETLSYGLNNQEKIIRRGIAKGQLQSQIPINGVMISKVYHSLIQESQKHCIQLEQNYVCELWSEQRKRFDKFAKSIEEFIQNPHFNFPRIDSNTISQDKDKNFIVNMFKKRVQKFQLLYRASLNNFKIHKFHEQCDGETNTMVLVRTQADKVIGGFTILPWNKEKKTMTDQSGQSFLFSVTEKQKYRLTNKECCITGVPRRGPVFGQQQIVIFDESHMKQSAFFLGTAFKGSGIMENSEFSNQHFSGSKSGMIKVKQWEVFRVHFAG